MTADKTHLDPRARRTLEALRGALATHMRSQQLSEISVSEICRTAGVHRTTFYKHFDSVAGLANEAVIDLIDGITSGRALTGNSLLGGAAGETQVDALEPAKTFAQWAESLARYVARNREVYYSIIGPKGDPGLQRALANQIVAAARRAIRAAGVVEKDLGLSLDGAAEVMGNGVFGGLIALVAARDTEPEVVWRAVLDSLPAPWQAVVDADWSDFSA